MRLYAEYPHASISMSKDEVFRETVNEIFKTGNVHSILESGTFNGLGSTTMLAETVLANNVQLKHFYTLEVEKAIHEEAKLNLAKYPFVEPLWGMSVGKNEALEFIDKDEAINHHERFPEIFIDSVTGPKEFYRREIEGNLTRNMGNALGIGERIRSLFRTPFRENYFSILIPRICRDNPLILLDSAGGIGLLEFLRMKELMGKNSYYLILDDVHHLKHFRSLEFVRKDPSFTVIRENLKFGWVVARHK